MVPDITGVTEMMEIAIHHKEEIVAVPTIETAATVMVLIPTIIRIMRGLPNSTRKTGMRPGIRF
jgi:hypothetical protein